MSSMKLEEMNFVLFILLTSFLQHNFCNAISYQTFVFL